MGWLNKVSGIFSKNAASNLGNSLKRRLGLSGPSDSDLRNIADANERAERKRLRDEENAARLEAAFQTKEGKGVRRAARISFGNKERSDALSSEQRSLRSTGRFDTNRLVL